MKTSAFEILKNEVSLSRMHTRCLFLAGEISLDANATSRHRWSLLNSLTVDVRDPPLPLPPAGWKQCCRTYL